MLVGVHAPESPAETLRLYPSTGRFVVREFVSGALAPQDLRPKFDALTSPWWRVNPTVIPIVSFKPRPDDVAAGRWDGYVRQLGQWLGEHVAAGRMAWVIPWHEPENDMPPGDFVAMFNRVRTSLKSAWPGATVIYSAMAYHYRTSRNAAAGDHTKRAAWMRAQADMFTADVYSGNTWDTSTILPAHPGFTAWLDAVPADAPWGITERGFQGDSITRGAAIREEAAWLKTSGCKVYVYWATPGTEDDAGWLLDALGRAAVNVLIAELSTAPTPPQPEPEPDPGEAFTPLAELAGHLVYTHAPTGLLVTDRAAFTRFMATRTA